MGNEKAKKRILTGDRPTGPLHLGHYVGSLQNRVRLQHQYDTFIIVADVQTLSTNFDHPENLSADVRQVTLDNLSVGLDPDSAKVFVQSMVPQIAELTVFFSMFITVNRLKHNPTIKTEAGQYGFEDNMTYGFLGYPVSQAADILFCRADLVPVGEDQLPVVEVSRFTARRFNELYAPVFPEPQSLSGDTARLVGLDGQAKMSKSIGNCIYLSDSPEDIRTKVMSAVTDPARIHRDDPGHPEICTIFSYQQAFNRDESPDIEERCRAGTIGCVACKKRMVQVIEELLGPIRERRARFEKPGVVDEILLAGTEEARKEGGRTMEMVRGAMHIDYFHPGGQ
ncbi:MAG: tryptophan--tRNA ligase [Candidatus Fermentibacteraceae bacterium]|nr:tryptophan--tRNA ligase [Candidatus Fermentibacteraceae bacterium]MBN2609071.1 tryptophan--tRNA ligase [Candidatus Fermentibacteraceae bacterium]